MDSQQSNKPSGNKKRRLRKRLSQHRITFYISSRPNQQPNRKKKISQYLSVIKELKDLKSDPKNLGDVFRHLEEQGIDCKKIIKQLARSLKLLMI